MATEEADELAYRPRYVAFVDVLGFSALVRAGDTDPAIRQLILGIVAILRETLARNPSVGFQFTQFSDCIVMSANCNAFGLHAVFSGCRMLAMNLLSHGILLRGGIAMGNLTHTESELFGVGLVAAHGFDKSGGAPRIALDPSIVAELGGVRRDRARLPWEIIHRWRARAFRAGPGRPATGTSTRSSRQAARVRLA